MRCTCDHAEGDDRQCPFHGYPLDATFDNGPREITSTGNHARVICETAANLVNGERNTDYGDALDNFTETAAMWSPILGVEVTAEQVALCMAAVKIGRLIHNPGHRDSWIDGVGYLALGGGIARRRESTPSSGDTTT